MAKELPIDDIVSERSNAKEAVVRARIAAAATQNITIADEVELVVPVLGSSKALPDHLTSDFQKTGYIIEKLVGKAHLERSAYLTCTLALVDPRGRSHIVKASIEGVIASESRGEGAGFESIFLGHDMNKTLGELPYQTRIRLSHYRKAFDRLAPYLERCGIRH